MRAIPRQPPSDSASKSAKLELRKCRARGRMSSVRSRSGQKAVKRTAPMALVAYSLVVLWFHRHGHRNVEFPNRPWYTQKQEPSFADMLTTLRALSWRAKFRTLLPNCTRRNKVIKQMIEFAARAA